METTIIKNNESAKAVKNLKEVAEKFKSINGDAETAKLALWEMFRGSLSDESINDFTERADLYLSLSEVIDAVDKIHLVEIE
tara:strand:- start:1637 stop:1882 length:246 start_codon:yes stop_codon:yes gene_type:complete